MVWHYDTIFINNRYEEEYHLRAFGHIAEQLKGYIKKEFMHEIESHLHKLLLFRLLFSRSREDCSRHKQLLGNRLLLR